MRQAAEGKDPIQKVPTKIMEGHVYILGHSDETKCGKIAREQAGSVMTYRAGKQDRTFFLTPAKVRR